MDLSSYAMRHYQHPIVRLGNLALGVRHRFAGRADRLDADAMHEVAARRTGLSDFGPPDYLEPLHRLVDAIDAEAGLHRFGTWMARVHLTDTLINRLLVARYRADMPASRDAVIRRPLFILGLPRTGSTMLHHLLAADPAHRWPSHLEVSMPAPPPGRARNPRLFSVERSWASLHRFAPDLMRKHPTAPHAPDECFPLFANAFSSPMAEYQWHIPGYGDWLFERGLAPAYAYFADQVRVLQSRRAGERWLFKSPMHLGYLDALFTAFPDACVVQLHRDPREVMGSACSLACTLRGLGLREDDRRVIGRHMLRKLARELRRGLETRRRLPAGTVLDLDYEQLVRDPIAAVRAIYGHFGFVLTPQALEAMQRHRRSHPKDRHGRHDYAARDFGLDDGLLRETFADYLAFRPSVGWALARRCG
jgi:hypothetical protein